MRLFRTWRRLAAALAVSLVATGCGALGDGAGAADDSPASVQLLVFGAPEELAAYRALVDAYERTASGAAVELVEASDRTDLIARLSTSIAGGAPPDLFLMNYRFYGQFAARDAIEPLDERLASSTVLDQADYYPAAMAAFRWQDRQLCFPQNISSLVVYYNRDLFQKYDVAEPAQSWTWNDLIATASALTRDAAGTVVRGTESEGSAPRVAVHGLGLVPSMILLAPFVWSNGGEVVDDPQRPTHFTLDSPEAAEALRNLVDLFVAYGVIPSDEEVEAEDPESRFLNGRSAMLLASRRVTTTLRASPGFDWDIAPLPTYAEPAAILHSDAYCMTRGSEHKDDAWRFLEYAVSAEGQTIIAASGRTVPSHIAVSRSAAFLDPELPPRNAQVFLDAIPYVRTISTVSTWPEIEDVSSGILENALYRGDRLEDVIVELDQATRPIFARGVYPD